MPPHAPRRMVLHLPGVIIDDATAVAVFDFKPGGRTHIERRHVIIRMTTEPAVDRNTLVLAEVECRADVIKRLRL